MITRRMRDTSKRMEILRKQYLMTTREIAQIVGVQQYVVVGWRKEKFQITQKNYEKVCVMMMKLTGRNIKYKRQAFDLLMECDDDGEI